MNKQHGLTLIEMMVTLAVFATLIGLGVAGLSMYASGNRLITVTNAISGDLSTARSEAIKRGINVTVCGSSDSTAEPPSCDTSQWEKGWIYFVDMNNDGVFDDGSDVLLGLQEALPAGITMRTVDFDDNARIRYRPNGAVRDTTGDGNSDGTIKICGADADAKNARAINVNNLGRNSVAIDTDTVKDNIVNDVTNTNITCP
jgi:type IV fimbrial biogenesis protein FimT